MMYKETPSSPSTISEMRRRKGVALDSGDAAPDFALHTVQGQPISLSDALRTGRNGLLVVLRHFGWLICSVHVAQFCQQQKELDRLNVGVPVIGFGARPQTDQR